MYQQEGTAARLKTFTKNAYMNFVHHIILQKQCMLFFCVGFLFQPGFTEVPGPAAPPVQFPRDTGPICGR